MAWQDTMIPMLRVLISDLSGTPTYSDERLEQMLVVSAQYVTLEITFATTYTITISSCTISPDPIGLDDDAFANFVVLKAACLTDWSTFRTKALISGIKARCGPAILDTVKHLDGFKQLLEQGPCAAYTALKDNYVFGNAQLIKAVLSPFVSNDFDPRSLAPGLPGFIGHARHDRRSLW